MSAGCLMRQRFMPFTLTITALIRDHKSMLYMYHIVSPQLAKKSIETTLYRHRLAPKEDLDVA